MVIVTPNGTSVGHSESFECLCVKFGLWVWPGRDPEKSHKTGIFRQISPCHGVATGYSNGTKFDSLIWPYDLITRANFNLGRLRTGCVALLEILLYFWFSALHRLSPLTQLGPAGPLVVKDTNDTIYKAT